jgi:YceI-like domain
MKKNLFAVITIIFFTIAAQAQKFYTKNGLISFFSSTKMEDIKADNNQVLCVLNSQTGDLQFSVLNNSFRFRKALMEEHFNENYIESTKYPKSSFKGTVADISKVNFTQDGTYPVTVKGDLSIHGVTKNITAKGSVIIKASKINVSSKFIARLADYNIAIPGAVKNNISENIEITVSCNLDSKM